MSKSRNSRESLRSRKSRKGPQKKSGKDVVRRNTAARSLAPSPSFIAVFCGSRIPLFCGSDSGWTP